MEFKWAGVPFRYRYSQTEADQKIVSELVKYDSRLDLKFYRPTEKWHLVRYLSSDRSGQFTRVWELDDKPELGLRRQPGSWLLQALRQADMQGAAENRVEEVDQANAAVEASVKREMEDYQKDLAKEMRKPLIRLFEEGPQAEHKGVF